MVARAFDVVLVPDFSEPVSRRFEMMTLLFLASWLEFGGRSRDLPLHLACIGEVPESVRFLADRCRAKITTHSPLLLGAFANKLRGFEIGRQTDHVLLLDSDMLVLSEIHDLSSALGSDCISASAANGPRRGPEDRWLKIQEALRLPDPQNRVIPLNLELDTFQCAPYRDREYLPPYYNGGVVYAPWASRLGDVWRDHFMRIFDIAPNIRGPKGKVSNQPSLVTAIAQLQLQGFDFQLLPDEYHVRWQHISAGSVTCDEARLLHTVGFGRWGDKTNCNTLERQIDIYLSNILRLTRRLRSHRDPLTRLAHHITRRPQIRDCYRVHGRMKLLYEKYVRELKR
jgi:hypothetical protein